MSHAPFNVLFLCTGNSCRSIMAEAILDREGAGQFKGWSAGVAPRGEVHPVALDLLAKLGHPTAQLRSKSWDELRGAQAPALDFIFTVCDDAANEPCAAWPGNPVSAHWSIPDPSAFRGTAAETYAVFEDAYRMLRQRIGIFTSLPIRSLDEMSLQHEVLQIGRG
jgi:protein-tyrosine-phosphatase